MRGIQHYRRSILYFAFCCVLVSSSCTGHDEFCGDEDHLILEQALSQHMDEAMNDAFHWNDFLVLCHDSSNYCSEQELHEYDSAYHHHIDRYDDYNGEHNEMHHEEHHHHMGNHEEECDEWHDEHDSEVIDSLRHLHQRYHP